MAGRTCQRDQMDRSVVGTVNFCPAWVASPTPSKVNSIGKVESKGNGKVGTPLCPYGNAYRRVYGLLTPGLFKQSLCRLLGGQPAKGVSFLPPLGRCTLVIPRDWYFVAKQPAPVPRLRLCYLLYPVPAALASSFRVDSFSTSYYSKQRHRKT